MRRSVGQKLVISFLALALLMAAIGGFSIYSLYQLNTSTEIILRHNQPILMSMAAIESATLFHSLKISQYVSTGNKAHLRTVDDLRSTIDVSFADLERHSTGTSDAAIVDDMREAYRTYRTLSDNLLSFYQANPTH